MTHTEILVARCIFLIKSESVVTKWRMRRPVPDRPIYMGCSDVSEFEHIYGPIFTTPSCVYDRLFT